MTHIPFTGPASPEDCIAALRIARDRILTKRDEFVCCALDWVRDNYGVRPRVCWAARHLKAWIWAALQAERLPAYMGVDSWLRLQGVPAGELTARRLREYRVRWIDQMIRYFGGRP